ncbi:MAG TPA: threonine-phosphate decarboxylase, partial [Thermodesulfobacteriota bacterium]
MTIGRKKDVHGGNIWEAKRLSKRPLSRILDFSASINPLGPPAAAVKAITGGIRLVPPYPDPKNSNLRKAISESLGIPAGNILPANGSTELIYLIPRLFTSGKALIIEPAFS